MFKQKWLIGLLSVLTIAIIIVGVLWNSNNKKMTSLNTKDLITKEVTSKKKEAPVIEVEESEDENSEEVDHNESTDTEADQKTVNVEEEETVDKKEATAKQPSNNKSKDPVKVVENNNSEGKDKGTSNKKSESSSSNPTSSNTNPKKEQPKTKDTITTKTTTSTESIPFKTVEQEDTTLEKGKTKVVQKGEDGTRNITYKETYTNGKRTSKDQISSKVTKQPVDKIVKVGTKEAPKAPKYLSASEAHSILNAGGFTKAGNTYTYAFDIGLGADIVVTVGNNHVSSIAYSGHNYQGWEGSLEMYKELWGSDDGEDIYNFAQKERAKIEKAVRAAANALYGSGTSQANSLYNQIINSARFSQTY